MDEQEAQRQLIRRAVYPLARAGGWMRFLAIVSVIGAIVSVISTWWTLFWMWLPIWLAALLWQAANAARLAAHAGGEAKLTEALESVGRYFKISGVLALISLVLTVIGLFFALPLMLQA